MRLTCREVTERASELLDGTLSPMERLALRAHLAVCRNCRAYLSQLRRTVASLRSLTEPLAEDEAERLLERILPSGR